MIDDINWFRSYRMNNIGTVIHSIMFGMFRVRKCFSAGYRFIREKTFTMENIVTFESLIIFYRSLFAILHFNIQLNTKSEGQIKSKLWLSLFKQNFGTLILLFCSIFTNSIVHIDYWCSASATQQTPVNQIVIITLLNVVFTSLALLQSFIYGKHLQKLWIHFEALNYSIKIRLNYEMNFRNFLKSFKVSGYLTAALCLIMVSLEFVADNNKGIPFWAQISILNTEILIIYTKMHAIFVIELFCYFFDHFNKYVNSVYHLNSSKMVYHGDPDIVETLKSYTKIHRELCSISRKINGFFGLSFLAFMSQTFICTVSTVYFFYSQWSNKLPNILSNLSCSTFY